MPSEIRDSARLLIIQNPTAGGARRRLFEDSMTLLREAGCVTDIRPTRRRGDAAALGAAAISKPIDILVAAGGDGTINEVITGLAGDVADLDRPPLAILPLGTANVLAAEIGLKPEPKAFAEMLLYGDSCQIGLGRLDSGACFAAMLGAGFDARVVAQVNLGLKRVIGKGAYAVSALREFIRPQARYRVEVDGKAFEAASVIVSKGRFYAGQFLLAPAARLDDGLLHVCLFERSGRWNLLRYAWALEWGRLASLPDFRIVTGRSVSIDGPAGDPLQADGDAIGQLPVKVELQDAALTLIVPAV